MVATMINGAGTVEVGTMIAEMRTRFHAVKVHWIKTSVMQNRTTSKGELVLMTMKEIMMTSIRLREARVP